MSASQDTAKHESGFKTGAYTPCTECYGIKMSSFNQVSYHCDTLDDANMKLKQLNSKRRTRRNGYNYWDLDLELEEREKEKEQPKITYTVCELEIDECNLAALKRIALREDINIYRKSKKELKALLIPIITHKKHLNRYQKTDLAGCELCISGKANEYDAKQLEQENNPNTIKAKAINKMYRKTMSNPIKESQVMKEYGLSHDDLEKAVIAQKIHFQRRSYFGNSYLRYEESEVIKYYNQLQKEEKETKKRKLELLNDEKELEAKKMKLSNMEKECDYKGVPEAFRCYKWLYIDCNELSDEGRNKIVKYLKGKYTRNDMDSEDIVLKTFEINNVKQKVSKKSVFRMLFKDKKWKKK
eukprot:77727_1